MSRTSKVTTASTDFSVGAVEEKEIVTEEKNAVKPEIPVEEKKDRKTKTFKDDDIVELVCENLVGRTVTGIDPTKPYTFDESGKCKVSGKDANRFLTIPGYELA